MPKSTFVLTVAVITSSVAKITFVVTKIFLVADISLLAGKITFGVTEIIFKDVA